MHFPGAQRSYPNIEDSDMFDATPFGKARLAPKPQDNLLGLALGLAQAVLAERAPCVARALSALRTL
jgi:hypothetical protein